MATAVAAPAVTAAEAAAAARSEVDAGVGVVDASSSLAVLLLCRADRRTPSCYKEQIHINVQKDKMQSNQSNPTISFALNISIMIIFLNKRNI